MRTPVFLTSSYKQVKRLKENGNTDMSLILELFIAF